VPQDILIDSQNNMYNIAFYEMIITNSQEEDFLISSILLYILNIFLKKYIVLSP
jgi:hypothetical protein